MNRLTWIVQVVQSACYLALSILAVVACVFIGVGILAALVGVI